MLTTYYSDILQNAPFRSQIFKIFFALGGKVALTPLTKIPRTFLVSQLFHDATASALTQSPLAEKWHHSQNRKYITFSKAAGGGSSDGRGWKRAHKFGADNWTCSYARGQTHIHADKHTDRCTHHSRKRKCVDIIINDTIFFLKLQSASW